MAYRPQNFSYPTKRPPMPQAPVMQTNGAPAVPPQSQPYTSAPTPPPAAPAPPTPPPGPGIPIRPPMPGPTPSPYGATGVKGAPIPGQTVPARPNVMQQNPEVTGGPAAPTPTPSLTPPTSTNPGGYSERAIKSHNEINSGISLDQWQAWDQYADPTCPPTHPYRGQKMINGKIDGSCEETPDNCPPGYRAFGQNECRTEAEVAHITGEDGGGGGGAAGPGGTGGGPGGANGLYDTQNQFLWDQLMQKLNQRSRYDPNTVAQLQGEVKQGAEQAARQSQQQSTADLASRGLSRSGIAVDQARQIREGASGQVLQARNQILKAKIDADYQDQESTLTAMQNWLNASRQAVLQQQATQQQKEIALAQIALQYAQLNAQFDMLREEYAQKVSLLGLGL